MRMGSSGHAIASFVTLFQAFQMIVPCLLYTSNDLVSIADAADLDLSTGMTLEAWVYPSTVATWRSLIFKSNGANDLAYALYAFSDGANTPRGFVNIGGAQQDIGGGSTLPVNTWTHLATTYDGSTLRVYVNGTAVGQLAVSGSILASTGALELGGNTAYGTEWFAGRMDEVRIYNRALSTSEIVSDRDTPCLLYTSRCV